MVNVDTFETVKIVTLDRPDVRNAFNDDLIEALTKVFTTRGDTRLIILRGNGPTFCAGGDLNWMRKASGYTQAENEADALKLAKLFQAMCENPAVVVVLAHGAAFGGGCGLVAAADVAIAVTGTKFCFSEVRLGLIPATISPFVIPKIGHGHARRLFATADVFDAAHACQIGLVHFEVPTMEAAGIELKRQVELVLANGPQAVARSKQLAQCAPLSLEESARWLAEARSGEEAKEGVAAFLEKRKASFVLGCKS
ncbi:MAG: enoyl-CoA hydratase/isomerase family protein [Chthonomonas sp.]|nr:enoyl-CoA hydratase/isomerase family protein [Chthonomonas sp.]